MIVEAAMLSAAGVVVAQVMRSLKHRHGRCSRGRVEVIVPERDALCDERFHRDPAKIRENKILMHEAIAAVSNPMKFVAEETERAYEKGREN